MFLVYHLLVLVKGGVRSRERGHVKIWNLWVIEDVRWILGTDS